MFQYCTLNFDGAHPHPFDLEHVVRAAHEPVVSVLIAIVLVASAQPLTLDGLTGCFMLVPVVGTDRIAGNQQVADLSVCDEVAALVFDTGFVTGDDLSAGSGADRARTVGDKHVQGFRGSDGIEDFNLKAFLRSEEHTSELQSRSDLVCRL